MSKLGWVALAVGLVVVPLLVAAVPRSDESAKLEEIRALLAENNRVQRIDAHRRFYRLHPLLPKCDLDAACGLAEQQQRTKAVEADLKAIRGEVDGSRLPPDQERHILNYFNHPYSQDCDNGEKCKQRENDAVLKKAGLKK